MEWEDGILSRVAANHLFLGQFEPFRATLRTLSCKNGVVAAAMLRAVVASGGCIPGALLSQSVPSASHLAWMCMLELQDLDRQIHNPELARELLEMLLYLEQLDNQSQEQEGDFSPGEEFRCEEQEYVKVVESGFLRKQMAGFYLEKLEEAVNGQGTRKSDLDTAEASFLEKLQAWVVFATVRQPSLMNSLCDNIRRRMQLGSSEGFERSVQSQVQLAHIDYIKHWLKLEMFERALWHVKYIREANGVAEGCYRDVVCLFANFCFNAATDIFQRREMLSQLHSCILSTGYPRLLIFLEEFQDKLLDEEEIGETPFPITKPFLRLHLHLDEMRRKNLSTQDGHLREFKREIFHYARVKGRHILEDATNAALAAIRAGHFKAAADVLLPFPRLRPLVAAMGWDLLSGATADRCKLLMLLWFGNRDVRHFKHHNEISCIEYLCERLCFNLEVAYFVADVNSGNDRKFNFPTVFQGRVLPATTDDFATNLVLECLAISSPLRTVFSFLPQLKMRDAMTLVRMQPVFSSLGLVERQQDMELLRMQYGLRSAVSAMVMVARVDADGAHSLGQTILGRIKDMRDSVESISNPFRRIWMLSAIASLLCLKEEDLQLPLAEELPDEYLKQEVQQESSNEEVVLTFVRHILGQLQQCLPSSELHIDPTTGSNAEWCEVWENQRINLRRFVDDWEWRVEVLRKLLLPQDRRLTWKSAISILHCDPPALLNICVQKRQIELGKEAIDRYCLGSEDATLLQLVEIANTEAACSLEISTSPAVTAMLCLDVAVSYAPTSEKARHLLEKAREMVSLSKTEAEPVSTLKLAQAKLSDMQGRSSSPLRALLSGTNLLSNADSARHGPNQRALNMLCQIIEDAQHGKGQFLSGKLHNLVKAFGDEDFDNGKYQADEFDLGFAAGNLSLSKQAEDSRSAHKTSGRRLSTKPPAYLSAFILYVATIGDIFDGADTTLDFNFFSLLYRRPGDLLTKLVFEKGSPDGAGKVAEVMGADLVHEVIAACVPPIYPPRALSGWITAPVVREKDVPFNDKETHELDLETTKYLTSLSPVRGILSCVLGDQKRSDFAIEQAERFPTMQRWIQMQANLQRLSDSLLLSSKSTGSGQATRERSSRVKRQREQNDDDNCTVIQSSTSSELKSSQLRDWEDEYTYQEAVEGLIRDGKLVDALAFADRWLKDGAPDKLLQLLIERGEDSVPSSNQWQGSGSHHSLGSNSWQYCIRLRDKRLAASLALKYIHRWELESAMNVLTMCSCHLPANDVLLGEVLRAKRALQQYGQVLLSGLQFQDWQEVESLCQRDPEGLALRLAGKGAVAAALSITESFNLSDDLRRELQGRQLVSLLTADPISGGGPAEALRFLGSLRRPEDALPVALTAMEQLPNLHSKQLLVHFMLKRQIGLSEREHARMDSLSLGLKMLGALPLPWQQRCSGLHEHPQLILETLLMWKQFQAASQILEAFPTLRNDKLIITYASKAITVPPAVDRQGHHVASRFLVQTSSGNKMGSRDRRFAWPSKDSRSKMPMKDVNRKRKSTLPPSQKAAWEAMAGYQEDRPIGLGPEGYEKLAPITMADEWVLTGDPVKDDVVRNSHKYESAPNFVLFKALLSLCFDQAEAAKSSVELCVSQIKHVLSAESFPQATDSEVVERAFHAAGTFVQGLLDARTKLHKILGNVEAGNTEGAVDGSRESQLSCLTKLLAEADVWLNRVELLHFLLGSGITAAVEDLADEDSALRLRDRLIQEERYGMAVYTCTKCKIDVFPVWEAWGYALLRIEHYAQARVKFKKALQLCRDDPSEVVQKIVDTMEACPPADVSAARSLYIHMAKSVSSASDDSLSADSYLNVLYIPTFTRAERSRKSEDDATNQLSHLSPDEITGPWSNLDNTRFEECKYYLDEYARQRLLPFLFRHGRYTDACRLFYPLGALPPSPSGLASLKADPLATEYGSVEDLCDACVGYAAVPNLESVIAARISASGNEDPQIVHHTTAALTRICNYFETHRHFNHLYKFQVLRKDYIAAALCCIQLFLNASSQDQALRHLERAKIHFDQGLIARQQQIENTKSAAKVSRGKSPSEKLTDEDLIKFSARVTIQMEIVRCFSDADGPPWKRSLFGNPSDNDTFKRRCEIAESLVEKNFDLAFQIIYDFGLPAVYIYAGVAAALAEKRKYSNLVELLRNVKGTVDDEDWDQIVGAAIAVYANKHRERPDRLIEMLASSHRKVLACVLCGRLKSAFQIASRSGNIADVQWVSQQARMTGALPVEDMCKQWLARVA